MMGVPVPALLAAIALLLWPAGRLFAVLTTARGERSPARQHPGLGWSETWRRERVALPAFAANAALLAATLAVIWLLKIAAQAIAGSPEPLIFGRLPLASLFDFAMLLEFAAFAFRSALDTYRAVYGQTADVEIAGDRTMLVRRPVLLSVAKWLHADLAIYAWVPAVAVVMALGGAGLLAAIMPNIHGLQ